MGLATAACGLLCGLADSLSRARSRSNSPLFWRDRSRSSLARQELAASAILLRSLWL